MGRVPFAPVAQGLSDFEAKVVTARLGADGILWEIRGIVDSVYPLGGIDVLVPVDELEAARLSLRTAGGAVSGADDDRDPAGEPEGVHTPGPGAASPRPGRRRRWVTAAVVAGVATFAVARVVTAVTLYDPRSDCGGDAWRAAAEGLTVRCRP